MKIKLLIVLIVLSITIFAQNNKNDSSFVDWKSLEEVSVQFIEKQKPILIWLYANDIDSCKLMKENTFALQEVNNYMNLLFYNIKIDAKTDNEFTFFDGQKFNKNKDSLYNSITSYLLQNNVNLPALVMFTKNAEGRIFYGYKDRDHIFPILIYYAEMAYENNDYKTFEDYYFKAYPVGQKQIMNRLLISWKKMADIDSLQKEKPKKILIDIYNNYSVSATMMRTKTFNNPEVSSYLNEKYYSVTVELKSNEEFIIKGITYKNSGEAHGYHQFAIAVLQGKMKFPAFIILDENYNLIERKQRYYTPEEIEALLKFYGENIYKEKQFDEYLKELKIKN